MATVLEIVLHLLEAICVLYAAAFGLAALRYVAVRRRRSAPGDGPIPQEQPPAAVLYLCCGDLDAEALESLSRLRYDGRLLHVLHDDATDPAENRRVDELVKDLRDRLGVDWQVLRRSEHVGGKPGAMQYVLERTAHLHEIFLLADNDSVAADPGVLQGALDSLSDPEIAVVQFRNRPRAEADETPFARTLAASIDVFDAFMVGLFEPLWVPFIGHNAVLRTRAVLEAGGFTPGFFADDIDLTLRLNLHGHRVRYRRDLEMLETHPSNYRAFCVRSRKWAIGCAQVLRAHLGSVLASRAVRLREKLGFLIFAGFYAAQTAMLAYVALVLVLLPVFLFSSEWNVPWWGIVVGSVLPLGVFLPVLAYLCTEGRGLPVLRTLLACTLTYGSVDLWTVQGVFTGFRKRERRWVPTNSVTGGGATRLSDWLHFGLGFTVLAIPLIFRPGLLLFPLTWLFGAKFLFVPTVALAYGPAPTRSPALGASRFAAAAVLIAALGGGLIAVGHGTAGPHPEVGVEIRDGRIWLDGAAPVIRGVHYSPWRLGTGPGKGLPYPADELLVEDLDLIASLHANAILVYEAPRRLLELARERGLHVLYAFHVPWDRLAGDPSADVLPDLEHRIAGLADSPALMGWMLGNEVPATVMDALGADGVRALLSRLRERIRSAGGTQPVCYGNWPLARLADLDRDMDLLCYNVYPFFPPEIAARGYAAYIREEILPRAQGRPLLITEFGSNTIEASAERQAEIITASWRDLLAAGAQGGMVFSFADEAWKNYDNPVRPPDWWRRQQDWNDHLTVDLDPEENYGIVTEDREPKPAFHAVRSMFGGPGEPAPRGAGGPGLSWQGYAALGLLALVLAALAARWGVGRRRQSDAAAHARSR